MGTELPGRARHRRPAPGPDTGCVPARLTAKEAAARREANADRLARLLDGFRDLDLDAVLISSDERFEQLTAFLSFAELRRVRRVLRG